MKKEAPKKVEKTKTRRPVIRGRNTPKNVHKAFRSHGNHEIIASALEQDRYGRGYKSALA